MKAPSLIVSEWLNTDKALDLDSLRGKVVAIHAFQMLCPGCVMHGVPQAKKLHELFSEDQVAVIGLHTVFEHHQAMGPESLKAFLHEFRVKFPVAIDRPGETSRIPQTMELYGLQGTPTWILIDRNGDIAGHFFGAIDDMILGSEISKLITKDQKAEIQIYRTNGRRSL